MTQISVIGIGSAQGADRAGWQAIDALQDAGLAARFPAGLVTLAKCRAPTELYQMLESCRYAILIDALPGQPGHLTWLSVADLQRRDDLTSVHGVGAGEMLALLETLAQQPPQLAVLGIGVDAGSDVSPLDRLSEPALCCLRGRVEQAIRRFLASDAAQQKDVSGRA